MVEPNFTEQTGQLHTVSSFIVVRVYYWTTVEWKELLPDSSMSHLDYESRIYDIGLCGTSMRGICYIIAEQYWEAWGLFWKRSVSLCFLGVLFGFGCWVGCVVVCCLVFVFVGDTLIIVSPFLSYEGIANQNKMYWWPSELRARTAPPKKKMQWQLCRGVCGGWTACKIERGCERIYAPGTFYLWSDLEALPLFSGCCEGYGHFVILITFVCMISTLLRRFAEDSPILVGFWTALPNRWWVWRISFCFVAWNLWEMCFWSFLGICSHLVAWELATTGVFEISGRFACIW